MGKFLYEKQTVIVTTVTTKDVYGTDDIASFIPDGYEAVDFRPPKSNDMFFTAGGGVGVGAEYTTSEPRLILNKTINHNTIWIIHKAIGVADVYDKIPQIPSGYTPKDFRPPMKGDMYLTQGHNIATCESNYFVENNLPRIIVEKE